MPHTHPADPFPPPPPEDLDLDALVIRRWDLYFAIAFGLAIGFNLIVIWASQWLPMGDFGGWVELIDVVARYGDPSTLFSDYYALPKGFEPNSLVIHVGSWLAQIMPANLAAKVLLSTYVVGLPVSILMVAEAFGRPRWLALFAAPMSFSALFNLGVLNFLVAMPLMFMVVAMTRTYLRDGMLRTAIGLAFLSIALFYAHVLAFVMALGLVTPVIILGVRRLRDLPRVAFLAPALLLLAIWVYRKYVNVEATEAGATMVSKDGLGMAFESINTRIENFHAWGMRFFRDGADEFVTVILALSWLGLMAGAQNRGRDEDDGPGVFATLRTYTLEILSFGCIVAYFALPSHMSEVELIAERVVIPILLLLTLWPRLRLERRRAHWLMLPVIAVAMLYPWAVHHRFKRFNREDVGVLPALIKELPPRSRMAYLMLDREIKLTYMGPLWHIPKALMAVENGGMTDDSFAIRPYCPVQFLPDRSPHSPGPQFWRSPNLSEWDYVLVHGENPPSEATRSRAVELVDSAPGWFMFKVVPKPDGVVLVAGGPGGADTAFDCAEFGHLSGFQVATGEAAVETLQPLCKERGERGPRLGVQAHAPVLSVACGRNETLIGLHGTADALIRSLGPVCLKAGREWVDEAIYDKSAVGFPETGRVFRLVCPKGESASGFRGRIGVGIDAVGVRCEPLKVKAPEADVPKAPEFGDEQAPGFDGDRGLEVDVQKTLELGIEKVRPFHGEPAPERNGEPAPATDGEPAPESDVDL